MARPLRVHLPGALYHVMSRGNARQKIFLDADDYARFLARLAATTTRFDVRCRAYCLMPNHYHLLLEPAALPLSRMMQQLNSSYSQWFNRRHGRVGHVLQGRFKALVLDDESYLRRVVRYMVLNPVRGRLVENPAQWPWSSYRATAGLEEPALFLALDRVWHSFDIDGVSPQQRFADFVDAGPRCEESPPTVSIAFGSSAFTARIEAVIAPHRRIADLPYAERFACRPTLNQLFVGAPGGAALDYAMHAAFAWHAYTLSEIGQFVGRPAPTVWRRIQRAAGDLAGPNCHQNEKIEI
jgi:REP element-mobilizing transposase RayT